MTVGLAARGIEKAGIATVCFSQELEYTQLAAPPRVILVEETPLGFPLGRPHQREEHRERWRGALELLQGQDAGAQEFGVVRRV